MILSFTGHRPDKLGGYGEQAFERLVDFAGDVLSSRQPQIKSIVVGGALGWDTAVAVAALYLRVSYTLAVPFATQEVRWPEAARERYYQLLEGADRYVCVCEGGYAPHKMQRRNEWMVDNSDALVALWNGSPGGTANCVAYAIRKHKPWINLWEHWK